MAREILPSIGISNIPRAGARKAAIGREVKRVLIFPGEQTVGGACIVVEAAATKVWGEQGIELDFLASETKSDEEDVAQWVRRQLEFEAVAIAFMDNFWQRKVWLRQRQLIPGDALDLVPARRAGDDESQI